jgi:hypothetical protein
MTSGVLASDYSSTFKAAYLTHGDSAAPGTFGGISWANTGAVVFQNETNAIIGTNNGIPISVVGGGMRHVHLADGSAPVDTEYYSTTQSKLCYKDSGGTVHPLY